VGHLLQEGGLPLDFGPSAGEFVARFGLQPCFVLLDQSAPQSVELVQGSGELALEPRLGRRLRRLREATLEFRNAPTRRLGVGFASSEIERQGVQSVPEAGDFFEVFLPAVDRGAACRGGRSGRLIERLDQLTNHAVAPLQFRLERLDGLRTLAQGFLQASVLVGSARSTRELFL
jgi:hypothetical protein